MNLVLEIALNRNNYEHRMYRVVNAIKKWYSDRY